MLGTNPVRHFEQRTDGRLRVQEIFKTIQGEGPDAGTPAVFIRLAGCNLRCHFCDTDFESNYDDGLMDWFSIASQAINLMEPYIQLVVLTGGEPFLQDFSTLILQMSLHSERFRFQVETAGTSLHIPLVILDELLANGLSIVISPKTPKIHDELAPYATAYKYLIRACDERSKLDGLPITNTQPEKRAPYLLARPPKHYPRERIFVQPVDDENRELNTQAAVDVAMQYGYRLSLQTHKIVGLP
jgi:7-carboxy-7-deazaguanine synthase